MRKGGSPAWDVRGHMVLCSNGTGREFEYRFRCTAEGQAAVTVDGVTYPVPKTMTAHQYFDMVFSNMFGARQESSGD